MVTMLLGGLWHGASWNFVFWGGLHGLALAFDKLVANIGLLQTRFMKAVGVVLTFHFVCFCWIFFRSPDFANAWLMISRIFTVFNSAILGQWLVEYRLVAILLAAGYLFHWMPDSFELNFQRVLRKTPLVFQSLMLAVVIWILFQARSADIQPFIYFQF
jgi:D-alanyl-lipoteichoic acid acyltransferase DltB (MBOAT superfamily)